MFSTGERAYVNADHTPSLLESGILASSVRKLHCRCSLLGCDCLGNSDWKSVPHIRILESEVHKGLNCQCYF